MVNTLLNPDVPTLFRMSGNVLTVAVCYFWLRFADVRDGCLDAPSVHHRVYLRILITLSVISLLMAAASTAISLRAC
jgi:hypothetical protein